MAIGVCKLGLHESDKVQVKLDGTAKFLLCRQGSGLTWGVAEWRSPARLGDLTL